MVDVTAAEGAKQGAHRYCFSVLDRMGSLNHLGQHPVVLGAVVDEAGKGGLLHQLLFAPEMHARELDQLVEDGADLLAASTAHDSLAQLVHGVHENAVLIVHGSNADGARVVPGKQGQSSLRKSLL